MARDFFDFIADSFYFDRKKEFLEILKKPNVQVKELKDFFDNAGYDIDEDGCQAIINARDTLASAIGPGPSEITY